MARFLHCADIHLDTRFYSMDTNRNAQRRKELRDVVSRIVDLAIDQHVDVVFMSGDLFDEQNATIDSIEILVNEMNRCQSIRFFISPGNHDPFTPRSHYGLIKFPKNVHVFSKTTIEKIEIPDLNLDVYGVAFVSQHCSNLLNDFKVDCTDRATVMVIHGDVNTKSPYNSMATEQIKTTGLDYLALGHVHKNSISKVGSTIYAYPGVPEGRAFDECGEKGVLIGEVAKGCTSVAFRGIAKRQYHTIEIDVTLIEDQITIINEIKKMFTPESYMNLYNVELIGQTEIEIDSLAMIEELNNYCYFIKIKNLTSVYVQSVISPDSLKGIFLSMIEERIASTEDFEMKKELALARTFGLSVLDRREITL